MKLRNKRTGEIGWLYCDHISIPKKMTVFSEDKDLSANHWDYASLAELNEEWEDYEEPKEDWYLDSLGGPIKKVYGGDGFVQDLEAIGNYFETEEEAKKAAEKLKAWKRLKDKGFRFNCYMRRSDWAGLSEVKALENLIDITAYLPKDKIKEMEADLDLLFGGEE